MGKRTRFMTGALFGAGIQYLYDPQAGRGRRARLKDQAVARLRKGGRELAKKARYQRGVVQGKVHEAINQ
jgi:hypothetical protein